jgi:peptidyl-prolyl cis-trans isomerase C
MTFRIVKKGVVMQMRIVALAAGLLLAGSVQAQTTIATVNGQTLTREQLSLLAEQQAGMSLEQLNDSQKNILLQQLVQLSLLAQEAEQEGLQDDPQVEARLEANRRAVLAQSMLQQIAQQEVDQDALQKLYEEQYSGGGEVELHARHILVEEEELAQSIIQQLNEGADFAELAREHSTGPTGERGGDLGWFSPEQMVPTFSAAASALEAGEYTKEPVQTRFGWHVILLEDRRTAEPPSFEQVEPELRNQLVGQRIQTHLQALQNEADVNYTADWAQPREQSSESGGEADSGSGS